MTADPAFGPCKRFGIEVDRSDRRVAVQLHGVLDQECISWVALWLTPIVLVAPSRSVCLDLSRVTSMTVEVLDTLADLVELAQHRHCELELIAGPVGMIAPLRLDGAPDPVVAELLRGLPPLD
jgi:ABC-type transporter Mla MlaB component